MGGVFANGLEISGKAVSAKTIAAMPDVCFTPPENPATPPGVPVPYPSFGMAGDTDKGTGTVKIGGKTVNIKNKSHLTKTTGTEAGSAAKKGIITSKNTGKEQFNSWSNDVKFDGEPVIRNTDMATNNHASPAGNTPPWIHIALGNFAGNSMFDCINEVNAIIICCGKYDSFQEACEAAGLGGLPGHDGGADAVAQYLPSGDAVLARGNVTSANLASDQSRISEHRMTEYGKAQNNACLRARRCQLSPKSEAEEGKTGCCEGQTGHHVVPGSSCVGRGDYVYSDAPCVCAEGASDTKGSHGLLHNHQYAAMLDLPTADARTATYAQQRDAGIDAIQDVFKGSGCSRACLESQLNEYHHNVGIEDEDVLSFSAGPGRNPEQARRTTEHVDALRRMARNLPNQN